MVSSENVLLKLGKKNQTLILMYKREKNTMSLLIFVVLVCVDLFMKLCSLKRGKVKITKKIL